MDGSEGVVSANLTSELLLAASSSKNSLPGHEPAQFFSELFAR